ncbi:hypothetical protein FGRMN_5910 [Fusarium graminum]|nr:hypothetical protein FGRMN_5910 [Fusarium graminum]
MEVELEGLQQRCEAAKAHDDEKHALITALLAHIGSQSAQLSKLNLELQDKSIVNQVVRDEKAMLSTQVERLQQEKDHHAFVFAIIDGDCMLFRDDLVQAGLEGGKQAISLLKQNVEQKFKALNGSVPPHLQVVVRIYANLKNLSKVYQSSGILANSEKMGEFIRGFNMGDPLCDYVDAGNGKECADEKVKASFRHHLDDVHCRQVFFGASADNGYARLLGPCAQDKALSQRICLIEGPPFERELAALAPKFETASFDIFRKDQQLSKNTPNDLGTNSPNYAKAARTTRSPPPQSAVPTAPKSPQDRSSIGVLQNSMGQRLDPVLTYKKSTFDSLKGVGLCNSFAILGKCRFQSKPKRCIHIHNPSLGEKEKNALRAVARLSVCPAS